jgi:hypothetical protein
MKKSLKSIVIAIIVLPPLIYFLPKVTIFYLLAAA